MEKRKTSTTHRAASLMVERTLDASGAPDREEVVRVDAPTGEEDARAGAEHDEAGAAVARVGFAPIVRVDAARREIELCGHGMGFVLPTDRERAPCV